MPVTAAPTSVSPSVPTATDARVVADIVTVGADDGRSIAATGRAFPSTRPSTRLRAAVLAVAALAVAGCGRPPAPAATPPGGIRIAGPDGKIVTPNPSLLTAIASVPTTDPSDPGTFAERGEFPLPDSTRPAGFEGYSWQHLLDDAEGTTVRFALRDADPPRAWMDEWVVDVAAGRYGIDVVPHYVPRTADIVAQLAAEKAAAASATTPAPGTVDLIWMDDASYGQLKDGGLLYGPWTWYTPSRRYLDPADAWLTHTFGRTVDGDALAWGRTNFVLLHAPARLPSPPASWPALWEWIEANPGRFTYAAPPDPTGSAFVRQACMALAADKRVFERASEAVKTHTELARCWSKLNAIAPKLWQQGTRYPATQAEADALFAAGDIDLAMRYGPPPPTGDGGDGDATRAAPSDGARAFVLDEGMLSRTHYLAIPFNAPNKQGAIVLANFLQDPEAQFAKRVPENWGDPTVIGPHLIPETWRASYDQIETPPDGVPDDVVATHRLAEPPRAWVDAMDDGWALAIRGRSATAGQAP